MTTSRKKPRTPAQQAADDRARERARQVREGSAPPPESGGAEDGGEDILGLMADFTQRFAAAKGKRGEQAKIATQIAELVDRVDWQEYPELLLDEKIQAFIETISERRQVAGDRELMPGELRVKTMFIEDKKSWTWEDIKENGGRANMPWVDYTPRGLPTRRVPVGWNGLDFVFENDVPVHVPKCFVDVLEESFAGMRRAREHQEYLMKQRNNVSDMDSLLRAPEAMHVRSGHSGAAFSDAGAGRDWSADEYLLGLDARINGEETEEIEEATA